MTQSQASAPPRGPDHEMRIASWNLGVPDPSSNMGENKIPTQTHYQSELCKACKDQAWSIILFQEVNEHWAKAAAEILDWAYVWNDKLALCWDMHVWELLDHEGVYLFPEEDRNVKSKMGRKVQVAPSSVALSSVMAPAATTRLCATAGPGLDCVWSFFFIAYEKP